MSLITWFIDFILHLDVHLIAVVQQYGILTYALLFLIIFLETGLVILPFLPGDSLIFTAGTIAALGGLNIYLLFVILVAAAILGDSLNYKIGEFIGPKVFTSKYKLLNKEYLERTNSFFEKHGGKTIVIARFLPIIRTFAPFLAGVGRMSYWKFLAYNVVGGITWVALFLFGGYFFGNLPFVKENFALVVIGIIVVSLMPAFIELVKHLIRKKSNARAKFSSKPSKNIRK